MARIFPRTLGDRVSFFLALFGMSYVGLFELLIVMPSVYPEPTPMYYFHVCLGLLLYVNILGWFFKLLTTSSTTEGMILPAILKDGWRYCSICESNSPPRSHHCFICDRCVMKRDHHCAFIGNCVGYANHRYFVTLIMYLQVAALYAVVMNFDYTLEALGGLTFKAMFTMLLPFMAYLTGFAGTFTFVCAMSSSFIVMAFLLLTALLVYHITLILRGQTTWEKAHNVHDYDLCWEMNLVHVFGRNWKTAWLCPLIPSELPGDGLDFLTRQAFEMGKAR